MFGAWGYFQPMFHVPISLTREPYFLTKKIQDYSQNYLRVVQYNVLAQCYTAFIGPPTDFLEINYRLQNLKREILSYDADIICLQELDQFDFFSQNLLNFTGVFQSRPGRPDGSAIFFRRDKFRLLHQFTVNMDDLSEMDLGMSRSKEDYIRSNIGLSLFLKHEQVPDFILSVTTTHLYWDPAFSDLKTLQGFYLIHTLYKQLEKFTQDTGIKNIPVMIAGDFNVLPNSALYKLLSTGSVSSDHTEIKDRVNAALALTNPLSLESAYSYLDEPITNYTESFMGTLDYIWYSKKHPSLQLHSLLRNPPESVLNQNGYLPNWSLSSDHLALVADFLINQKHR
jgi:CCR4-NOT transcription complex subunit 6